MNRPTTLQGIAQTLVYAYTPFDVSIGCQGLERLWGVLRYMGLCLAYIDGDPGRYQLTLKTLCNFLPVR